MSDILPPRVPPLELDQWDEQTRTALARWMPPMNFHKTMAHNPRALIGWIDFGNDILFDNLMQMREREIVILRVAARIDCAYEWGAHRRFSLAQGVLTAEEADRLAFPVDAADWTVREAALIAAVDDIQRDGRIGDAAWAALTEQGFTPAWFIDLIYLVGEFNMVGTFMKSFRIELEEGFVPIPRA